MVPESILVAVQEFCQIFERQKAPPRRDGILSLLQYLWVFFAEISLVLQFRAMYPNVWSSSFGRPPSRSIPDIILCRIFQRVCIQKILDEQALVLPLTENN